MPRYTLGNLRIPAVTFVRLWIWGTILCYLLTFTTAHPLGLGGRNSANFFAYSSKSGCRYQILSVLGNKFEWLLDAEPIGRRINSCTVKIETNGFNETRKLKSTPYSITPEELAGALVSCGSVTSCVERIEDIYAVGIRPASQLGRKLLSLQNEEAQRYAALHNVIVLTVLSAAVSFLLVLVLILCTCNKSSESDTDSVKDVTQNAEQAHVEVGNTSIVNTSVTPLKAEQNGVVAANESSLNHADLSASKQSSHDHRELPELPHDTSGPTSLSDSRHEDDPEHEYDHLHQVKKSREPRSTDYDHVDITDQDVSGTEPIIKITSVTNTYAEVKPENIYAGIKDEEDIGKGESVDKKGTEEVERGDVNGIEGQIHKGDHQIRRSINHYARVDSEPYEVVKDVTYEAVPDLDPYNKVRDEPYNRVRDIPYTIKDDPYNRVKDSPSVDDPSIGPYNKVVDDPYNKVVDDPYNRVVDDPYNRVVDDPYNTVKDDPYNRVGDDAYYNDTDPYNRVVDDSYKGEIVDPYNRPRDSNGESGGQMNRAALIETQTEIVDHYSVVNPRTKIRNRTANVGNDSSIQTRTSSSGVSGFHLGDVTDEYATVVKTRSNDSSQAASGSGRPSSVGRDSNPYSLPPEPPRQYEREDIVSMAPETLQQGPSQTDIREPRYTKVTARESLASVHARQALNTYEVVLDTENTYATVEGGSGDGIVKRISSVEDSDQGNLRDLSEDTYTEIGSSAGASAPTPPSLDSLQQMSRQKPCGLSPLAEPEVFDDYATVDKTPPMSPKSPISPQRGNRVSTGDSFPQSPGAQNVQGNGIVLNPDYQLVRDCVTENDSDLDPNYESVDEAKSKSACKDESVEDSAAQFTKFKPSSATRRGHVYEEVHPIEERQVRDRVMRLHTYEEITEVKQKKEELSRKSVEFSEKL